MTPLNNDLSSSVLCDCSKLEPVSSRGPNVDTQMTGYCNQLANAVNEGIVVTVHTHSYGVVNCESDRTYHYRTLDLDFPERWLIL